MRALSYETAEWADGPQAAAWLEREGADFTELPATDQRMIQRWRSGAQANFWAIDRVAVEVRS